MTYDRTDRIRRAAILIASLEETVAEHMLDSLPSSEATKILDEAERLGEVDPEEVRDVLDEFRAAGRGGRAAETAVEFTYTAPQVAAKREPAPQPRPSLVGASELTEQQEADAALMAELLTHEHPQTIAAALSRLGHEQGAAVFAKLPAPLQLDVLDRLANLETADEDAVKELETQLHQRVEQQRERRERALAAAEMARRMLERTPAAQRDALLARLSPDGQTIRPAEPAHPAAAADSGDALPVFLQMAPQTWDAEEQEFGGHFEAWTDEPHSYASQPPSSPVSMRILLEDRSDELEALDDRSLLAALRQADERTVQCALAASSEKFLNRVAGKLPRRQANRLRQMVRSIGPTRLTELREAQHELLRLAHESRSKAAA